jgi:hypothetical protein
MQCACTVSYCHLWPVCFYHIFPHYLINGTFFGKHLWNIKCVSWFFLQQFSETFLVLKELSEILAYMYIGHHVIYPLFLSDFNEAWIFSADLRKILPNFIKIRSVGAELFHADAQIWRSEQSLFAILRMRLKSRERNARRFRSVRKLLTWKTRRATRISQNWRVKVWY